MALLFGFGFFILPQLPLFVEVFYGHLLNWAGKQFLRYQKPFNNECLGPIFFLVQAVQIVRLIMEMGKIFAARREENIVLIEVHLVVPSSSAYTTFTPDDCKHHLFCFLPRLCYSGVFFILVRNHSGFGKVGITLEYFPLSRVINLFASIQLSLHHLYNNCGVDAVDVGNRESRAAIHRMPHRCGVGIPLSYLYRQIGCHRDSFPRWPGN